MNRSAYNAQPSPYPLIHADVRWKRVRRSFSTVAVPICKWWPGVQMVGANFSVGGEAVAVQNGSVGESVRVKMPGGQLVVATVLRAGVVEVRIE